MHTKIGFDHRQFDQIYRGKGAQRVWLDFGKVTSTI